MNGILLDGSTVGIVSYLRELLKIISEHLVVQR